MKGKLVLAALAAVLLTLPCNAVSWTGTEWNGDSSGAVGERSCDIVSIGREPARTDSIPYGDFQSAVRAAQDYDHILHLTVLHRPVFLLNSCLGQFSAAILLALLLPKLRSHFAEFLNNASPVGLRILSSSTCVGLRYGYPANNSGFS